MEERWRELLRMNRLAQAEVLPWVRGQQSSGSRRSRTKTAVAARAGMSRKNLGKAESGEQALTETTLCRFLAACGVPLSVYFAEMAEVTARLEKQTYQLPDMADEVKESPVAPGEPAHVHPWRQSWQQARRGIRRAAHDRRGGFYGDSVAESRRAAARAVTAVLQVFGRQGETSVEVLLEALSMHLAVPRSVLQAARSLDRRDVLPPTAQHLAADDPSTACSATQANEALRWARQVLRFCLRHLPSEAEDVP